MFPSAQETADFLQKREQAARVQRKLRAEAARQKVERIVRELVTPPARVWLIGSLAWGEFGTRSDVDLVLSGVDWRIALQLELSIARAVGVPVDMLELDHLPDSFCTRILQSGQRLV